MEELIYLGEAWTCMRSGWAEDGLEGEWVVRGWNW